MPVRTMLNEFDSPVQCTREALVEHILWLIRLRWIAVASLVVAGVGGTYVFRVLETAVPIYICAGLLLLTNIFYFWAATKNISSAGRKETKLGMIQVEADLVLLTAVLYFSGGITNPCFLFYIFPIITATIILPRKMSYAVGLTAIILYGLLAVCELSGETYYPLRLATDGGLWKNPVYLLGAFAAFVAMVVLAQYLTKVVITRMTAKELEAARNKDVLEAVITAMAEGLLFVTSEGNVAICNPAAELWKKSGNSNANESSINSFMPALAEHIKSVLANREETGIGKIEFHTDGPEQRYIEARGCHVIGIDGQRLGYVIVGQDLTEHRKLAKILMERTEEVTEINEMLKMSRVEMAQREKMVAIGQMATGIAHEIGNPLASISSVAQYLGRKIQSNEQKENLLIIQYHVNRISKILKRMLSLSRPATSEYKWTDIDSLIDNTLSLINFDKRAQSVAIQNIASPDLPMVWLNPQHFEQVLLNIFINALDAINAKQQEQEHILKITREFSNDRIEIRISDTGIGMSPEVCRRAFESFFTTKEIGKGTGLGLFISYNLVTEVDGTIELDSEPGKGTTVIIRIPLRPKKDLISAEGSESNASSKAKTV